MYISIKTVFSFSVNTETFSKMILLLPTGLFNTIEVTQTYTNKVNFNYTKSISIQGKQYISKMNSNFIETKENEFKNIVLKLLAPLKKDIDQISIKTSVNTISKTIILK